MTENYHDAEGNPVSLDKLCRTEPEWAANCIRQLRRIAEAAALVSSMSTYDEDADEVSPCHMVYFEELENALIPWRQSKGGSGSE